MRLRIEHIKKSYGKTVALADFSAELGNGIYALLGPNGSGKSTLLNILTDNLKQDAGHIYMDGEDIVKLGAGFRKRLGFMPQFPGLYPNFSAENYLRYMAVLKGLPKERYMEEIKELLTTLGLDGVSNHRISSFSGGMKQRLAIAQALLGGPDLIILDEPTAGLDPMQRIAVRNLLSRISAEKTVIIGTHIVSDVELIAKQVIFLKKGVIIENSSVAHALEQIRGRVWQIHIDAAQASSALSKYIVSTVQKDDFGFAVRLISDEKPCEDAIPVQPSLEDCYTFHYNT